MADPDQALRLNTLYRIIDKRSNSIRFQLNNVQSEVLNNLSHRNIILKARQLGMSTFSVLYLLDTIIFNSNINAGIVSYSLEHAQHIFKKILGHAIDNFLLGPGALNIKQRSAKEITLNNGSSIRVDTTLRGGSYQCVLVSEFGKICARNPAKAEEIITGTLQAVPQDGQIIIESTGEGTDGYFAEMVLEANRRGNENLSPMDYKLFFFPWFSDSNYFLTTRVEYEFVLEEYFRDLEAKLNITLSKEQRYWYAHQRKLLQDKIKQEYPSTIEESFLASSDAFYFAEAIAQCWQSGRCVYANIYDPLAKLYVAMDIGVNDLTVLIFFQIQHGEIRVIDYYEDSNKDCDFYAKFLLQDKKYLYDTIFLPHDSTKRSILQVENTFERDLRRLFNNTGTKIHVLPRMDKQLSISHARVMLSRFVFNVSKVKKLIDMCAKYRKKWCEATGKYSEEPWHNVACFVGDTLIETENGLVRIDCIKVGDKVLTPNGYQKVKEVFKYNTNNLITFRAKEHQITCTPQHQFFTKKGLIIADSLRYTNEALTKEDFKKCQKIGSLGRERNLGFKDYFLSMSQEQLFILMGSNTQKTSLNTGLEVMSRTQEQEIYTGLFGYFTRGKSLINTVYIIWMEINQTIQSRILNLFPILTICECTCPQRNVKNYQEKALEKPLKKQRNGTSQKKGEPGIVNMEKNVSQKSHWLKESVFAVKRYFQQFKNGQNIVHLPVSLNIEDNQVRMMKKENVMSVTKNLCAVDLVKKNLVHWPAERNLGIEREVYDLTVENDHCYFANGFLVSNSNYADSLIYCAQSVGHIEAAGTVNNSLDKHREVVANRAKRVI